MIRKNEQLEKYALLINNSAELICIIDAKSLKFEEMNDTVNRMLGYTAEEMKGTSILSYISEEDRHNIENLSKENNEKFSFETCTFGREKMGRRLHWNVVNKNGFWLANARDASPRKETGINQTAEC